jgi:hypothetical protein
VDYQSARTHREASIETDIHSIAGQTGIPGNTGADLEVNLAREGHIIGTVRVRVYKSAVNMTRKISEAKTAAKSEWKPNKPSKHHGYRLKGKAGGKRPIPMNGVKTLTARFYQLKSAQVPVGKYLKRLGQRDDEKCWSCGGEKNTARTWEHRFHHCSRWKDHLKTLWKEVGKTTGWRVGRCRHVKFSELLSIEKWDHAVMDFPAANDVRKFPHITSGGKKAGWKWGAEE